MSQNSDSLRSVGVIVGVFAAIGVGLGLTGFISIGWIEGTFTSADQSGFANSLGQMFVGLVFLQSVIITFFTGPTVAALAGLVTGISKTSKTRAAGISGIGAFVGFYIMVLIAILVMSMAYSTSGGSGSGGSGSFDLVNTLVTAAKAGIPTAAVGVVAGYIGSHFEGINISLGQQSPSPQSMSDD
ncbi:hypothetical protein [Halorussus aquaticus]|uniref:DUF4064 domain-containing protein n=1 Tax=Halorussus aquaticus TaxID=2953748 RepID=A0ABD5Q8E9_9EURY|nr:hypothetical protein [Halorussus aquaticus]